MHRLFIMNYKSAYFHSVVSEADVSFYNERETGRRFKCPYTAY